MDIFSHTTLT